MKIACGTDIVEINRIEKAVMGSIGDRFLDTVYTEKERQYCESHYNNRFQHYAARFAAKEAIFKAISETLENKYDITWTDVEIINDTKGKPKVNFLNKKFQMQCEISISHCKTYAVATAIITD